MQKNIKIIRSDGLVVFDYPQQPGLPLLEEAEVEKWLSKLNRKKPGHYRLEVMDPAEEAAKPDEAKAKAARIHFLRGCLEIAEDPAYREELETLEGGS